MINFLGNVTLVIFIYLVIATLWIAAEKVFYGQITSRGIDTVVAIILAFSLYFNIKNWL